MHRARSTASGRLAVLAALGAAACGDDLGPIAAQVALTAISFNVAQLVGPEADGVVELLGEVMPDVAALQECVECEALLAALPGRYALATPPRSGVTIAYDDRRWQLRDTSVIPLGVDDDGWGERVAVWAQLLERDTGSPLEVYSTHFCVPVRRDDDRCTEARQVEYAGTILRHIARRPDRAIPLVLGADLNVFIDFEHGQVVRHLLDAGLIDIFRIALPDAPADTFQGNSWAPPGRIDYLLSSAPVIVLDADLLDGRGSDHSAVFGHLRLGVD
jgi:endonuclease/exonuclease/phosphatase family metal-dependent hydrolase